MVLNWDAPQSDGGEPIFDYVVELSSDNGQTWNTYDDGISVVTETMISGLENNHRYLFRVFAVNMVGDGPFAQIDAMPTGFSSTGNYERPPPKIMGAGFYQIDTNNISDEYSKILLDVDIDSNGLFKQFVPYSMKSDKIDQETFGGFSNYEKRGQYVYLEKSSTFPTFFGKVGKPIQIQIRLEDQFASTKIEHLSLYTDNQSRDKSSAKIELNWNKGKPLSVIDQNGLLDTASAYFSLEDGFLWVVFDLVFEKEMETSDIFLESWNEMRDPSIKTLHDSFKVSKSDYVPKQRISLSVDVDLSHDTSNPTCHARDACFTPYNAKILKGGVISWINNDSFMHDVESGTPGNPTNEFDLHIMPGETLQKKFEKTGVFSYFCRLHPWATGMVTVLSEKQESIPVSTDLHKPVLHVASETSSGSIMIENTDTVIIPNKDLTFKISGHIKDKKKGQPIIVVIMRPDATTEKLRTTTMDKGYYFIPAKLNRNWQEGDYTVTTFYKNDKIASITFFVTDKKPVGFGGKLFDKRAELEKIISEYVDSSLLLTDLDNWMKENGYDKNDIEFIHEKLLNFGLKK
ncbi:MAG: fibronectin type III domain-containing protein [Nitrosopumilus sp.]|uniref:fibronectin type III domain-containing protein n=1 Tax=Nitrosopumilus sp. TaxID=2024843 RepID=UPI00247EC6BF|nr:fibronectin type III domain-containing protein [Nitrosopumilus sp.]MCV0392559.1 fibronectin type III domain-containing protein [Nitrosopumilus sp.]